MNKAQTAIEYIMLIGAVILFVVIVFLLVQNNVFKQPGDVIGNATKSIGDAFHNILR